MELLKGAPVAAQITEDLSQRCQALKSAGITACLAILRVGAREDDLSYERAATKRCEKIGIETKKIILSSDVSQDQLEDEIKKLNEESSVHGVLMFRPLPKHLDEERACSLLAPEKDIDGITPLSMARLYSGYGEGFPPCTARASMEILKQYGISLSGKKATVIGRSLVIGKPVSLMLLAENATVTICHSRTENLRESASSSDILVCALGKGESIDSSYTNPNQVVIDVGINWSEKKGKLVGDVDFEKVDGKVLALTPVPGGVGSVTTSILAMHLIEACERTAN